jgi:aspartate kinase
MGDASINVDMIVQNTSADGVTDMSFTVPRSELKKVMAYAEPLKAEIEAREVIEDADMAKVSVVGVGMKSHSGVASTMFSALADNGINIEMISTSEIKISCVIHRDLAEEAVRVLHRAFELDAD